MPVFGKETSSRVSSRWGGCTVQYLQYSRSLVHIGLFSSYVKHKFDRLSSKTVF